ncbi:hypothetical protein AAG906_025751 [Vitis piasezkii]
MLRQMLPPNNKFQEDGVVVTHTLLEAGSVLNPMVPVEVVDPPTSYGVNYVTSKATQLPAVTKDLILISKLHHPAQIHKPTYPPTNLNSRTGTRLLKVLYIIIHAAYTKEPRLCKNDEVSMHITPRFLKVPLFYPVLFSKFDDIPIHAENIIIIITNPTSFELLKPKSSSGEERISNANALPEPVAAIPVESWPNKNGQKLQINA